ncbi:hypothetical protein DFH08DRAFT_985371 [Mycena albidolilacea]|uniref:CFEM domain-containing protein n=1 Tax=Mycena albidolilacea TaxID=1033008 RepID=A0AAD7AC69_9AGAR|nr:hypothetical protein DFH08DRAFT_985371 [Mycena albidolilacea]
MLNFFTVITAGLFIVSVNLAIAQDSGGLTPDQQCLLNCSLAAVNASGCDIQNTACVCASAVYASNLTQCTESNCGFSASDIQNALTSNCANVTRSASTSSVSSTPASSVGPSGTVSGSSVARTSTGSASKSSPASTLSGSGATSSESGNPAPNSAELRGRTGIAAVSVVGLILCALLV